MMQGKKANGVHVFWNSTAPPVRCLLQEAKKKSWNNSNKAHLSGTYFFYKDQIYKTIK